MFFRSSEMWELRHRPEPLCPVRHLHVSFPGFAVQIQVHKLMPGQACELRNFPWDLTCNTYCNRHISYSSASTVEINAPFKALAGFMAKLTQTAASSDLGVSSFSFCVIASRGMSWQVDASYKCFCYPFLPCWPVLGPFCMEWTVLV